MTLIPQTRGSFYVSGIFSNNSDRILKGASCFFRDSETSSNTEMDAIVLEVIDANGDSQLTITTETIPTIELESPANVYVVNEIPVDAFPDGYILLRWTGTFESVDYVFEQQVEYNEAPSMVFINGATDTLESFDVVLNSAKSFALRVVDSAQNSVDGYAVQGVFYDRSTSSVVERVDASLVGAGTGLWNFTKTLSSSSYSADLDRYEIYWRIQLTENGSWYEIQWSRHPLKVYGEATEVRTGVLSYCTNEDVRKTIPGIDAMLSDLVANQAEREILLNQKRFEASQLIGMQIKNTRARKDREILRIWECYEVYKLILISAMGFAKFGIGDVQFKEINNQIHRIKSTLFSPISTVTIGGRQ
jgi:hypothetical protein